MSSEYVKWDRALLIGSALIVPVPPALFYTFRAAGLPVSASEDIVTLIVMGALGGPHVVATFLRSWFDGRFVREEKPWLLAAAGVIGTVMLATVLSVFFNYRIAGVAPLRAILTIFFFWASFHITQQTLYCIEMLDRRDGKQSNAQAWYRDWWKRSESWVVLVCLYPISLFRMSMADMSDPDGLRARSDAFATQMVRAWSGSDAFTEDYVFRIGRATPVIPSFLPMLLLSAAAGAVLIVSAALFIKKSLRERRDGALNATRAQFVLLTGLAGLLLPTIPNLDSAFQGFNAWHCTQYLYVAWLLNRQSYDRSDPQREWIRGVSAPGAQWKFYKTCVAMTAGAICCLFAGGYAIQYLSDGGYRVFGFEPHELPLGAGGKPEYRPGSILITYYLSGFGVLLVHYLYDTRWFAHALAHRGRFVVR
ncbi:MAG: hypothetical protein HY286_15690 [Planctomycetes bacterium]|nr:hypothetical protein [Planctomycetota bacterium]